MSLLGKSAPNVTLYDTKCQAVDIASFQGKKLIVAFFPAAFTGVCTQEMCTFNNGIEDLRGLGAELVAVSVDAPFANGAFAAANNVEFNILSDFARHAVNAFGVAFHDFAGMPGFTVAQRAVFIIDENGTVAFEWIAPNPGVEPDYDAVKAALG